jgi:protein-L-isoaspartate(D-aspartate) O-methyltransferase
MSVDGSATNRVGAVPRDQQGLARLVEREPVDARVVEAFQRIDRADFVPADLIDQAYVDRPVALPQRQTTSQPSLIARMVDAAGVKDGDVALEVGTGYGFQTALLATLSREVVSIELHADLAEAARKNLETAGIENVVVLVGDGWEGAPDRAPFDAIVVSAAAESVPHALVDQLTEGGRMVIPIKSGGNDDVWLFEKRNGVLHEVRLITPARFVPLVRSRPK